MYVILPSRRRLHKGNPDGKKRGAVLSRDRPSLFIVCAALFILYQRHQVAVDAVGGLQYIRVALDEHYLSREVGVKDEG